MAVVNVNSIQYAKEIGPLQDNRQYWPTEGGKIRFMHFKLPVIAVASDITSVLSLGKLSPGKVRILPYPSLIKTSAWGGGATLDFGIAAYVGSDGKSAVAAGPTDIASARDVSGALNGVTLAVATSPMQLEYWSAKGLTVIATVGGISMPIAATLEGHLAYEIIG